MAAKLVAPAPRPDTIVRERVLAVFDEALARPLTVVTAPAGYGKTTAVATWLATLDGAHAWVSLDALDNDPRRLCAHLLAGIDRAFPGSVADARQALDDGSDLLEVVVPLIVDALVKRGKGWLVVVLDDYHLVDNADCHAVVAALIEAVPPSVRVIVSSRAAPALRVARRRAMNAVSEVGARELAFQDGESERLLNDSLGLGLEHESIAAIEARVEGWPAGLALVASSLATQADPASYLQKLGARDADVSGTAVAEYLVEEVLDQVGPRLREFLCRTSILGRLSGPLCAAVLDDDSAHELLAEVRRSNLFVTALDERGEWVRYHHLFAELLERELRTSDPELVPVLHTRAAEWFAANDLPEEAIAHATAAGDGRRAAAVLFGSWFALMQQWRFVTMRRLIARMPADRGELAGFCEALDTVCWALEGADLRLVARRLDALEPLHDQPGVAPIVDRTRVSPFYGDVGRAVKDGWTAWERYPDLSFRTELSGQFGMTLWFAGDPAGAREIIEPFLDEITGRIPRTWAFGTLAFIAVEEGDLELAERYGRQAVEATAGRGQPAAHFGHTALAEALRLRGALDEAAEQLAHAAHLSEKQPTSFPHAFTLVFEAQLALTRHDRDRAHDRARAARAIIDRYPDPGTLASRLAGIEAALDESAAHPLLGTNPTRSELRILEMLDSDRSLPQIAAELHLSRNTIRSHLRRIYQRLGVHSRQDAVALASDRGLLQRRRTSDA
jgi:LuxR family transcriptional regulator, maltose regulon positive regulatory protein